MSCSPNHGSTVSTSDADDLKSKTARGILVADDVPDLVRGLARILKARGWEVYEAIGGRQAVDLARTHHPQVALMDIMMPDLNGLQACREIRAACPDTSFIFMTGHSYLEATAREEGAVEIFRKPVDCARLLETLERLGFV